MNKEIGYMLIKIVFAIIALILIFMAIKRFLQ